MGFIFLSNNVGIHFLFTYYFPIRSVQLVLMFSGNTPKILHCFIDRYGFQPDSCSYGYYVQHAVINKLLEYGRSGSNEYFTRL
jgi:hypothetical protein